MRGDGIYDLRFVIYDFGNGGDVKSGGRGETQKLKSRNTPNTRNRVKALGGMVWYLFAKDNGDGGWDVSGHPDND